MHIYAVRPNVKHTVFSIHYKTTLGLVKALYIIILSSIRWLA